MELLVWNSDNDSAWKTYELRLKRIDVLILPKSVFTHKSMAKTNTVMAGLKYCSYTS